MASPPRETLRVPHPREAAVHCPGGAGGAVTVPAVTRGHCESEKPRVPLAGAGRGAPGPGREPGAVRGPLQGSAAYPAPRLGRSRAAAGPQSLSPCGSRGQGGHSQGTDAGHGQGAQPPPGAPGHGRQPGDAASCQVAAPMKPRDALAHRLTQRDGGTGGWWRSFAQFQNRPISGGCSEGAPGFTMAVPQGRGVPVAMRGEGRVGHGGLAQLLLSFPR